MCDGHHDCTTVVVRSNHSFNHDYTTLFIRVVRPFYGHSMLLARPLYVIATTYTIIPRSLYDLATPNATVPRLHNVLPRPFYVLSYFILIKHPCLTCEIAMIMIFLNYRLHCTSIMFNGENTAVLNVDFYTSFGLFLLFKEYVNISTIDL